MATTYTLLIDGRPAPPSLMEQIASVTVEQKSDSAAIFRLRIALSHQTGRYLPLDDQLFRPLTPVSLLVTLGPGAPTNLIDGYVSALRAEWGPCPMLEVVGMDASATVMNLTERIRVWPNMADSDIAAMLFQDNGLLPLVVPTMPYRMEQDVTVMQRGTDIRFLRYLAERNGYECSILPGPTPGTSTGYFGPPRLSEPTQATLDVGAGPEATVTDFTVDWSMLLPAAASAQGLDSRGALQSGDASSSSQSPLGTESTLTAVPAQSRVLLSQSGLITSAELQTWAQATVDRSTWVLTAEGSADPGRVGTFLTAGRPVKVQGAGSLLSGTYLVNQVQHEWTSSGYEMRFKLRRNATGLEVL